MTGTYSWLTGANAWLGAASLQLGSNGYATTGYPAAFTYVEIPGTMKGQRMPLTGSSTSFHVEAVSAWGETVSEPWPLDPTKEWSGAGTARPYQVSGYDVNSYERGTTRVKVSSGNTSFLYNGPFWHLCVTQGYYGKALRVYSGTLKISRITLY